MPPLPDLDLPGPLGPPPEFPKPPAGFQFPKESQEKLNIAIAEYPADQVTSYLLLHEILNDKQTLDEKQKEYLRRAGTAIEKRVQEVLKREPQDRPCKPGSAPALLVRIAARSLPGEIGNEANAALTTLNRRLLLGYPMKESVFSVTKAKAEALKDPYTEGSTVANNKLTLTPKAGYQIVRVTAEVENISQNSDPGYRVWGLGSLGRIMARFMTQGGQPQRLADSGFAYVIPASGDWIPCVHVCEGCHAMRVMAITADAEKGEDLTPCIHIGEGCGDRRKRTLISDSGTMHFIGGNVPQGGSFHLDLLFTLPEMEKEIRFVLLGTAPIRLTVTRPQPLSEKKIGDMRLHEAAGAEKQSDLGSEREPADGQSLGRSGHRERRQRHIAAHERSRRRIQNRFALEEVPKFATHRNRWSKAQLVAR